ncbi:hypothetical protein PRZ48_007617 [Zasmidium cellare]|uniref:Uncharacterized protein n=1 Tax=Zasmidium cellare TaxID=395010 RepID=A0ABR0EKZ8_ZASCE|nr:hypothetical protein PRZ48_007617 [Zasmidium cellare]
MALALLKHVELLDMVQTAADIAKTQMETFTRDFLEQTNLNDTMWSKDSHLFAMPMPVGDPDVWRPHASTAMTRMPQSIYSEISSAVSAGETPWYMEEFPLTTQDFKATPSLTRSYDSWVPVLDFLLAARTVHTTPTAPPQQTPTPTSSPEPHPKQDADLEDDTAETVDPEEHTITEHAISFLKNLLPTWQRLLVEIVLCPMLYQLLFMIANMIRPRFFGLPAMPAAPRESFHCSVLFVTGIVVFLVEMFTRGGVAVQPTAKLEL